LLADETKEQECDLKFSSIIKAYLEFLAIGLTGTIGVLVWKALEKINEPIRLIIVNMHLFLKLM
jgi:hypothetical protein